VAAVRFRGDVGEPSLDVHHGYFWLVEPSGSGVPPLSMPPGGRAVHSAPLPRGWGWGTRLVARCRWRWSPDTAWGLLAGRRRVARWAPASGWSGVAASSPRPPHERRCQRQCPRVGAGCHVLLLHPNRRQQTLLRSKTVAGSMDALRRLFERRPQAASSRRVLNRTLEDRRETCHTQEAYQRISGRSERGGLSWLDGISLDSGTLFRRRGDVQQLT
jgi:hypothetical protein